MVSLPVCLQMLCDNCLRLLVALLQRHLRIVKETSKKNTKERFFLDTIEL